MGWDWVEDRLGGKHWGKPRLSAEAPEGDRRGRRFKGESRALCLGPSTGSRAGGREGKPGEMPRTLRES